MILSAILLCGCNKQNTPANEAVVNENNHVTSTEIQQADTSNIDAINDKIIEIENIQIDICSGLDDPASETAKPDARYYFEKGDSTTTTSYFYYYGTSQDTVEGVIF